ncbi:hypothetical protein Pcinc_024223 [Petrolisthes cinctipes]|uniref:Uncharacterized protein n=1 Tax=Petrolisthes cinctipes TaxID=88211 RepID=A0AAE1FB11_PETCI|nr:hypothetical protein Pcinc_024223 [Petrolisthes cinctipes]
MPTHLAERSPYIAQARHGGINLPSCQRNPSLIHTNPVLVAPRYTPTPNYTRKGTPPPQHSPTLSKQHHNTPPHCQNNTIILPHTVQTTPSQLQTPLHKPTSTRLLHYY